MKLDDLRVITTHFRKPPYDLHNSYINITTMSDNNWCRVQGMQHAAACVQRA